MISTPTPMPFAAHATPLDPARPGTPAAGGRPAAVAP
jgi:hypothetical protein